MARKTTQNAAGRQRLRAALDAAVTALSCLLLLAILVGLAAGRHIMLREASRLRTGPIGLVFDWPPLAIPPGGAQYQAIDGVPNTWLDVKSRRTLESIALSHLSPDPFDAGSLRAAQEALMATGWFADECTVARESSGVVRISGDWREPVAAVRFGNRDYVVAAGGERLPADYPPDASGLKTVIGPHMDPPQLGAPWLGGDVQAGLSLLFLLHTTPFAHQVAAIDISEHASRKRLLIITDSGATIVWGGEPGQFHAGQARDDVKLTRLLQLFRESGRIDKGQDLINVSLSSGY
jgi:hypothetical protein